MFIDPARVYFWDRLIFLMICHSNRRKKTHALPSLCAQSPQHNVFMDASILTATDVRNGGLENPDTANVKQ